jgi:peptide-methionine (S)-S-oxide reductase
MLMLKRFLAIALLCCTLASCAWPDSALSSKIDASIDSSIDRPSLDQPSLDQPSLDQPNLAQASTDLATATFAGGCFWCMEGPFDQINGVVSTTSGYTGGQTKNPTYEQVSSGRTGHTESVQVVYDPKKVDYATLLNTYWHNVDPLDSKGQFCDKGSQYRSGIFYGTEEQARLAEASKAKVAEEIGAKSGQAIATEITPASVFYPAEDYHQDYYTKNPVRYKIYRKGCGRDRRLAQLWGDQAGH